jgi:hypothetical protein
MECRLVPACRLVRRQLTGLTVNGEWSLVENRNGEANGPSSSLVACVLLALLVPNLNSPESRQGAMELVVGGSNEYSRLSRVKSNQIQPLAVVDRNAQLEVLLPPDLPLIQ